MKAAVADWETSSSEASDNEANSKDENEDLYYAPGSLPKLQFRFVVQVHKNFISSFLFSNLI